MRVPVSFRRADDSETGVMVCVGGVEEFVPLVEHVLDSMPVFSSCADIAFGGSGDPEFPFAIWYELESESAVDNFFSVEKIDRFMADFKSRLSDVVAEMMKSKG